MPLPTAITMEPMPSASPNCAMEATVTGNPQADLILGGDDVLIGGPGAADELIGGDGNDIYQFAESSDTIVETATGGSDTVFTLSSTFILPDNVETVVYLGAGDFLGIGGSTGNAVPLAGGFDCELLILVRVT